MARTALLFALWLVIAPLALPVLLAEEPPANGRPGAEGGRDLSTGGSDLVFARFRGNALEFEQPRFGGEARLFVRQDTSGTAVPAGGPTAPAPTPAGTAPASGGWRVYRGTDLETILRNNPSLANHPELAALRARVAFPSGVRVRVENQHGMAYELDPETRQARLFARGTDGVETVWSGADLHAIVRANPELARRAGFPELQTRVRAATAAENTLRFQPGTAGMATVVFQNDGVNLTRLDWLDQGWQRRSFEGKSLQEILQRESELGRTMRLGSGAATDTAPGGPTDGTRGPGSGQPAAPGSGTQPGAAEPGTAQPGGGSQPGGSNHPPGGSAPGGGGTGGR